MDTDYKTDYETDYATEAPLPTPGGTPYRTPHLSRHASRNPTPSPSPYPPSSSPPPHGRISPPEHQRLGFNPHGNDGAYDENISILDPRRFTPTLHANLVAEILSLRRELETKTNFIEALEYDLAAARTEHESATTSAATAMKEARDVKRQLARAESHDAISEVAQERDEAVGALGELKKQMERLTKSRRQAEEDLQRIKRIQERDSEKFEDAKRMLERRAHVAEGRLKAVLDEIAAQDVLRQSERAERPASVSQRPMSEDHGRYDTEASDSASVRTMSLRGRPTSLLMGDDEAEKLGISLSATAPSGLSLADELDFDGGSESEDTPEDEAASYHSEDEVHHADRSSDADPEDMPEEMVSDAGSIEDVDELPDVVDMGIQVVPEINYDERITMLESLLEDKSLELEETYAALDQKSGDVESLYTEIDEKNNKILELDDKLASANAEASERYKEFEAREAAFAKKMEEFILHKEEVDNRVSLLADQTLVLEDREKQLEGRLAELDTREKGLDGREQSISTRESELKEELAKAKAAEKEASARETEIEQKHHEREHEANIRKKRASGVVSPPPPPRAPSPVAPTPPAPVYTTSECQTTEPLPTPSPPEPAVETRSSSAQTDPVKPVPPPVIHVPGIMITPPPPTPPLPPPPKPVMKNASVQTKPLRIRAQSMQTEEIRLDERLKRFAPHLLPSAIKAAEVKPITPESPQPERPAPAVPRRSSKRASKRSSVAQVPAPTPVPPVPSLKDSGNGTAVVYKTFGAGERSDPSRVIKKDPLPRNLFNGTGADLSQVLDNSSGDDGFHDESDLLEYRTPLTVPRPRKQKTDLSMNPNYPSPVAEASEGSALRRQTSIRKAAMVSSGVQAHARARSPSLTSNRTTESGGTTAKIGPPFPVPVRHSSRRPAYISDRERRESPTPRMRNGARGRHGRQQSIRKVRSATALPNRSGRTRSPPPLSTSSAAPDSPELPPPLPKDEITSSTLDRTRFGQSRHRQQASNQTSTTGQASVGSSVQQTSVVDAIAQTMVGEWMWKYVRRRKSFGVAESPQADETSGGQRHKRWVWLAPYERAVMWSSRQPTSGSALLGKSGRKRKRSIFNPLGGLDSWSDMMERALTNKVLIQSVLDVKDDTPLPKNASAQQSAFNRSILILTPARALKFTAPNRERHYVWLTALSFLSHSTDGNDGLLALPPPMPFEYEQMQQQAHQHQNHPHHHHQQQQQQQQNQAALPPVPPIPRSTNAFSPVRDSVRLAKGKARVNGVNGQAGVYNNSLNSTESFSAEPPSVPRYPGHVRRRSNSGVRPQTRSTSHGYERSMASYAGSVNGDSMYGVGGVGIASGSSSLSHGINGTGWEAGTVRMEAFVERPRPRYEFDEQDEVASKPSSYRLRRDRRPSKQESFWNGSTEGGFYNGSGTFSNVDADEFFRSEDPFREF